VREAALGPRAVAPDGFDPGELMHRLVAVYDSVRRGKGGQAT
jgi:hypothetical protein